MSVRLLDRATESPPFSSPSARPASLPDPGYEALFHLTHLQGRLAAAVAECAQPRWKEPPVFFFDPRRQAQFEIARASAPAKSPSELASAIEAELPALLASVEVRRAARAIEGLREVAEALAPRCPPARDLAELLAVPDDEVFVVLHPATAAGFRLVVRGVVDVGQFHLLMAEAITRESLVGRLPGAPVAVRFLSACRDVNPAAVAGVPMVASCRFQLYSAGALRPDGTLPPGLGGCGHWLWPAMPLSSVRRLHGERMILLGPPAYEGSWDLTRRFPALAAQLRIVEVLSPARVAERLARLSGTPIVPPPQREAASKAA